MSPLQFDHERWLLCDGRSLSRLSFPELFAVVRYSFGGDGGDLFTLPDARGRVPAAVGEDTGRVLGDTTGSETHTLAEEELPTHTHVINASTTGLSVDTGGSHTHTGSTNEAGNHTHTVSNGVVANGSFTTTASGTEPGVIDPNNTTTIQSSEAGNHSHTLTIDDAGAHVHTLTDPQHTHTAQTTGSSEPFSIMQPTIFIGNAFIFCGRRVGEQALPAFPDLS
jgi:hypothetical protein